jgi:hypothetical protein
MAEGVFQMLCSKLDNPLKMTCSKTTLDWLSMKIEAAHSGLASTTIGFWVVPLK